MKRILIAFAALAAVAAGVQLSLPPALTGHVNKLKDAQGLKAKILVNEVGGAQTTIELTYAKSGMLRIESPTRLVVGDGKTVTVLDKQKNSYTQTAYDKPTVVAEATHPTVWGWAAFHETDPAKLIKAAKAGAVRKFRGADTTEVEVTLADGKTTATMFIETKTGVAKGYQMTVEDKQYIVAAETIEVLAAAPPEATFAFAAPAGATKVEPGAVADVSWTQVAQVFNRNCMPCHSAAVSSGTLDLSSYQSVANHRFVVKGESKVSILALSLRAAPPKRMPQGRPPLPESQIKIVEAWIDGGLRQ